MPEALTASIDWRPGSPLAFETERFRLRSLAPADITEAYVGWWNDEEIRRDWARRRETGAARRQ